MKSKAINIYENKIARFISLGSKKNSRTDFEKTEGLKSKIYSLNFSHLLNTKKKQKIIDVGCGIGRLFYFFSKFKKHKYFGIEVDKELIELATKVKGLYNFDINLKLKNIFSLKSSSKFDLVFCCGLIDCFNEKKQIQLINILCKLSKDKVILEKIRVFSLFNIVFFISKFYGFKKIFFITSKLLKLVINIFNINRIHFLGKLIALLDDLSSLKNGKFSYSPFFVKNIKFYLKIFEKNNFKIVEKVNYRSLNVLIFEKNKQK